MKQLKYISVLIFILLINTDLLSQEVVISEYYNSENPTEEWTEILVISDNFSLVNYSIIDSQLENNKTEKWAGGVQFADSYLWRNLRSGTIIIIRHRGTQLFDINKSDGYIEIGAENSEYFVKINNTGIWEDDCLNIESEANILQITNNFGIHVHALSHAINPDGVYNQISTNKLNYPGICSNNESISVAPGANLNNYSGGSSNNLCAVSSNQNYITKGTPNKKQSTSTENLQFWQQLRQPNWKNQNLTANVRPNEVDLFWTLCEDINPSDLFTGYIIVRINSNDLSEAQHPKNGTTYQKGDWIGKSLVISDNINSNTGSYSEQFTFDCNESYEFRVYAYRYTSDHLLGNSISPSYGRGRTYNINSYASTNVRKTRPIKPIIDIVEKNDTYCAGDSVLLNTIATGGPYEYTWFLNSNEINGAKKRNYFAQKPGLHKVRITNEKGCYSESDEIELFELPSPQSVISISGKKIFQDTTIVICEDESYTLSVSGGERYEWFKDHNILANTSNNQLIDSNGIFYAVAINNGMDCKDTTVKVTVKVLNISYTFDKDTLFFNLDKYTKFEDQNVTITNLANDTLKFLEIAIPPGGIFSLFTPPPAEIVPANEDKIFRVRFEPDRSGDYVDSISCHLPCKNAVKKIYLFAHKEPMIVRADPNFIQFEDKLDCDTNDKIINLTISNNEKFPVELQTPILPNGYKIINSTFPLSIGAESFEYLTIAFTARQPGDYTGKAVIPFLGNDIKDKLYFDIAGKVKFVSFKIEYYGTEAKEIEFPELIGCEDSAITSIQVFNTGEVDITIDKQNELLGIYIDQLPILIKAGQSEEIKILFVPETEGNFDEILTLSTIPCDLEYPIRIKGSKNGITYGFSKRNINFENVINCKDTGSVLQIVELLITGDSNEKPKIVNVKGPKSNVFLHNFIVGQELSDTTEFEIYFQNQGLGDFLDTIRILIEPCSIEKIIELKGNRINPIFNLSKDTLDFGNVEIETTRSGSISIFNSSPITITIDKVENISPPFNLISFLPIIIEPDSSFDILFEYSPLEAIFDTLKLRIYENNPCNFTKEILLIGKGDEHKDMIIDISAKNYNLGSPGDEILIPFYLKTLDSRTIADALIDSFAITIKYNPTLLFPKSVIKGESIKNAITNLHFAENPPGIITIYSKFDDSKKILDGKLFDLDMLVLLGNSMNTDIEIIKTEFKSKINIVSDTTNGVFQLVGDCNLEDRLIQYNNSFSYFLKDNISNGTLEITFELTQETYISCKLYNNIGHSVKIINNGNLTNGKQVIECNISELPDGVYFLIIGNKLTSYSEKILLMK